MKLGWLEARETRAERGGRKNRRASWQTTKDDRLLHLDLALPHFNHLEPFWAVRIDQLQRPYTAFPHDRFDARQGQFQLHRLGRKRDE